MSTGMIVALVCSICVGLWLGFAILNAQRRITGDDYYVLAIFCRGIGIAATLFSVIYLVNSCASGPTFCDGTVSIVVTGEMDSEKYKVYYGKSEHSEINYYFISKDDYENGDVVNMKSGYVAKGYDIGKFGEKVEE